MAFSMDPRRVWAQPEADESFRALADHMAQLVWMADAGGSIYWCNLRWYEYTGASLSGIQGDGWTKLCHPEHVERVARGIQRAREAGEPWEDTFPLQGRDGRYRWFLAQVLPLRDEHEQIVRWLGTGTDVTERRWVEQLHEGERRVLEMVTRGEPLSLVLETLTELIEDLTDEGLLASILLLDQDGVHLRHGAAPHLPAAYNQALEGLEIGPQTGSCGTAAYRREMVVVSDIASDPLWDGYRDLALPHGLRACWSAPIIGADGRVLGTFAIYHREPSAPRPEHLRLVELVARTAAIILERYGTEALRSRLAAIVDFSTDAIIGQTLDGHITSWNRGAEALYGYRAEEIIGNELVRIVPDDRRDEYWAAMARAGRGEQVPAFDTVRLHSNGQPVEISLRLSPIVDPASGVVGVSAIARDIADRRALERLQNDLTAMVVHDLRNPVAGITLSAQLLQRVGEYKPELVDRILAGTSQLGRLIDDLLDASRVDAGRIPLQRLRMDLVAETRGAVEQFQGQTTVHAIRLEAPDRPLVGEWDQGRVGQVLANLLNNAIKYAPDGGEIIVSVADAGAEARVSVRDQGLGIAPEHLPHVFERFYRAADAVAAARSLGLGLYITRGIVEAHGGQIAAMSAGPGTGSTFTFTLPYARPS
jgi:PAS domain S-box-containing protein